MGMGIVDITTEKTYVPDNKPELIIFDLGNVPNVTSSHIILIMYFNI